MQLNFRHGTSQAPRGHAIIIVRPSGKATTMATYCVVLPIQFSIGRYLPPILASQLPVEGMSGAPSFMPIPPLLEEIPNLDDLVHVAQLRQDDVIEVDSVDMTNEARRMEIAAEICQEYAMLYLSYIGTRPTIIPDRSDTMSEIPSHTTQSTNELEALLKEAPPSISDRDQLSEIAKLIGTLRYGMEGNDKYLIEETQRSLRRTTAPLGEKYRTDALIEAALIPGERGQKLADLYLMRAYKLLDEDYPAIPAIEDQIRQIDSANS
jgi:hypothetical protein